MLYLKALEKMPLFLDCGARVMARPQQHVLAAVLQKAFFRAAAP